MENNQLAEFIKNNKRTVKNVDGILDPLIYKVCAHTGLKFEQAEEIVLLLFEEIGNEIIDNNSVKFFFGSLNMKKFKNSTSVIFKGNKLLDQISYE